MSMGSSSASGNRRRFLNTVFLKNSWDFHRLKWPQLSHKFPVFWMLEKENLDWSAFIIVNLTEFLINFSRKPCKSCSIFREEIVIDSIVNIRMQAPTICVFALHASIQYLHMKYKYLYLLSFCLFMEKKLFFVFIFRLRNLISMSD